ncbi:alpha-N-methyltransferase NTM1 [Aspergillus unguis]
MVPHKPAFERAKRKTENSSHRSSCIIMSKSDPPTSEERSVQDASAVDDKIDATASIEYWNRVPATADAMLAALGSYPWYSRIDLRGSKSFLAKVRRLAPACPTEGKLSIGVDCGAGVGRVTEGFLGDVCETVDAVEPVEQFTQVLQESSLKRTAVIGDIYCVGLENWYPEKKYDLIWTQFCVGHLKDCQLIDYVKRCRDALTKSGIMVVKENLSTDPNGLDMYDDLDSSVTRTDGKFKQIFRETDMNIVASELQLGFPKAFKLLPVKFYALRPKD